jgi:hypothetical protein
MLHFMPNFHALTSALSPPNTHVATTGETQGIGACVVTRFALTELVLPSLSLDTSTWKRNDKQAEEMFKFLLKRSLDFYPEV